MKLSTRVKPISYLKNHAAEIVKEISESRAPMRISESRFGYEPADQAGSRYSTSSCTDSRPFHSLTSTR